MKIIRDIPTLRLELAKLNQPTGFVPTMGNLHAGHLSLIERSAKDNNHTILSIFINPTQFNNQQDYEHYPVTIEQDCQLAQKAGVDLIFIPDKTTMYPDDYTYQVHCQDPLMQVMEAKYRPGHFEGVLTIVLKLLILIEPTRAYFSEKDYQQLHLVSKLAQAFLLKSEIIPCPIKRLPSGLPLSSRNTKLSDDRMQLANQFAQIVRSNKNPDAIIKKLNDLGIHVEYIEEHYQRRFVAVYIDNVRLIDNFSL